VRAGRRSGDQLRAGAFTDDRAGSDVTDHTIVHLDFEVAIEHQRDGPSLLALSEQEVAFVQMPYHPQRV
jgi:hypothetical protein